MWTPATRKNYSRNGLRYQSDVTDEEWRVFEPYLPPAKGIGRPRGWPLREIVNGIFYVMRSGCPWRKGAAEDEFEEDGFEETVSTGSVKPPTQTEIEAINSRLTSLGTPQTDTPFSKSNRHAEEGRTEEIENTDSKIASNFLASMFGATTTAPVWVSSLANADANGHEVGERHVTTRERDAIEAFLRKWDRKNRATYFAVSTVRPGATTRSKATLAELNGLHVDIDFKSIAITAEEAECKLQEVMHLPSKIVHSGGGLHGYWLFKEALPATTENIERVEGLLRLLADHLGGDPACAEASRLMRLPGSHNTKAGAWIDVRVIADQATRYEVDDLADWLETASPVIHRKPAASSGNGHDDDNPWLAVAERFGTKPPIDVEARLAAMVYQGAGGGGIRSASRPPYSIAATRPAKLSRSCWRPRALLLVVLESAGIGAAKNAKSAGCVRRG